MVGGDGDKDLLRVEYILLRGISSGSNDLDEDDEGEDELDLVSEEVLDHISTISAICELELPSGASEASGAFEHPASS